MDLLLPITSVLDAQYYPRQFRDIHRSLTVVTAPEQEPVALEDAKSRLRIEIDDDDVDLVGLIAAARRLVEHDTNLAFISRGVALTLDALPWTRVIEWPTGPLLSVASVTTYDVNDTPAVLSASAYLVDTASVPGRICLKSTSTWPSNLRDHNAVVVQASVGFGDDPDDVPDNYRLAMLLLMGHWYENREAVGTVGDEIRLGYNALISDRIYSLA